MRNFSIRGGGSGGLNDFSNWNAKEMAGVTCADMISCLVVVADKSRR